MPSALRFLEGRPVPPWRAAALQASLAACGFALFAATWKLWTPQDVFPQVPLVAWAANTPTSVQWASLAVAGVSMAAVLILAMRRFGSAGASPSQASAIALLSFAASTSLLFLIDQHRLQPWAFQFVVIAIVLACLPARRAFVLLRWLTVSIYFWSVVAKCDYAFLHTQGQQFVEGFAALLGMSAADLSPAVRLAGAWCFPLTELLIAIGLCLPLHRSRLLRRCVLSIVVAMHLLLIVVLSPLGLNHQLGVLIWNVWFIAQALLLFGGDGQTTGATIQQPRASLPRELTEVLVEFLVAAVILLPALNLVDRYDHWLAWGLYAPRNSRATLLIPANRTDRLPEQLQRYLTTSTDADWVRLRLDDWSLDELAVPIYPQDRFQLGAADAVIRDYKMQADFQIILESPADRLTGHRRRTLITSLAELQAAQKKFLLNAQPQRP